MSQPKKNKNYCCDIDLEVDDPVIKVIDDDYDNVKHKPKINGVELQGNLTLKDLGIISMPEADIEDSVDKALEALFGDQNVN